MTGIYGSAVKRLHIVLKNPNEFAARYLADVPHGGLLLQSISGLTEGDLVEVRVRFEDSGQAATFRGLVLWTRRNEALGSTAAGIGFFASETTKREEILASLERPASSQPATVDNARCEPRYSTVLKVNYRTAEEFVADYTSNISRGGLYVHSEDPPELGTEVMFQLYPPGSQDPLELPGLVAWRQPGKGFGVRLQCADDRPGCERFSELLPVLA